MKDIKLFTPKNFDPPKAVQEFKPSPLEKKGEKDYQATKAKYGALAVTDPDIKKGKSDKDLRFSLNPETRQRLSVDLEEKKYIEQQVQEGVRHLWSKEQESAKKVGYQEGFDSGYQDGFEKAREEAHEHVTRLENFIQTAEVAKTEILKANERFVLEMIFQISKMVILKEIKQDPEYLIRLCRALIEKLDVRENIRVQVSPEDLESMSLLKEHLQATLGEIKNLNIESSASVPRGGVVVDTQWGAIEASLESQLQGIHSALVGENRS